MSGNSYKEQKRFKAIISAIIILIIFYLSFVTTYDAFVISPKRNKNIQRVYNEFMQFKTYMDGKIPDMESAIERHEAQIKEQNKQLEELNTLTVVLKEGK